MNKVKTLDDLRKMRESLRTSLDLREKSNNPEQMVQIKEVMSYFIEALDRERVDALVTQTGCMGYCYAEPTVEITVPGKEPLVFGRVNKTKVDEIITSYIKQGILIDDIIPVNYNSVGPE